MSWIERAACRKEQAEVFFPEDPHTYAADLAAAKATCARCPVWDACLVYALTVADPATMRHQLGRCGIYGGHTPAERTALMEGTS